MNVHTKKNPKGAIRGQVEKVQPTYTAAYGSPGPDWGDDYEPDWGYVGPWDDDEGWGDEGYGGEDFDDGGGDDDDD